ncbi:pentatricopeptide repeat-containing protein At3g13150-like [Durio zibethinus]|uniref:Pentatricopeptide repeat-containing protein At3g13150-like n=1 Tax=Durio zibethinus TaxID=66656 RepID=A0A6P5WJW8_DURZI|nr:pentatricopeptide repeat-containing protein At3g13150-like [Durio zibethinus]
MSKATEASSFRRLVGLFTSSLSSTTDNNITTAITSSKSKSETRKLQKLASKFKQCSESNKFRNNYKKTYALTVHRLASAKQFSLIDDILQHQKKYKEICQEGFVIRLIMLYGKAGMFEYAQKLFDEMPELKCDRTVKSFNALLSAVVHSKKFDKAGKLLEQLPEKVGIEPDLISYNTVIKAFCEMGSMDSAFSVVDTLEKKGLGPDIVTFNTLLDGFFSKGRIADGEEIWGLMERKNVVPNIRSYNSKLRGLVSENMMLKAVEMWEEMESKGIQPDVHSYTALITGYCNDGNLEQVKKWYSELKKSFLPDRVTYLTLISFLRKENELEMALELCKEATDRRLIAGAAFIDGLVKELRIEEAIQLVESGLSRYALKLKFPS